MAVEIQKHSKLINPSFSHDFTCNKLKQRSCNQTKEPDSTKSNSSFAWISTALILIVFVLGIYVNNSPLLNLNETNSNDDDQLQASDLTNCYKTCSISVVESVPQNLTILKHPLPSTFNAWHHLISNAKHSIDLAAYKSSLRGKHVLGSMQQDYSYQGDQIFADLEDAGLNRSLKIRMVENSPSKDKGDNADGIVLFERGVVNRRTLNLQRISNSGIMHSKFIITDDKNFYLGSANLDWRSLNQKLEMGVLVQECSCLAKELKAVFDFYWLASEVKNKKEFEHLMMGAPSLSFNMNKPLKIRYKNVDAEVYIASSPKPVKAEQTWDLDAIVHTIDTAKSYLYIHVMDIFPIFLYSPNKEFWPIIDNAIRNAVLRGVHVKIISAALHYPRLGLTFLKSLELINDVSKKGSISIIFKVPTPDTMESLLRRERRTHKKFLVSDDKVLIATSNFAADYFESVGTGTAIVVRQSQDGSQPFINEMRSIFERDFASPFAHTLDEYYDSCITSTEAADFCETEKDVSFLATSPLSTL